MNLDNVVLTYAYGIVGIICLLVGGLFMFLHKLFMLKAKKLKKRAGNIYLAAAFTFINVAISEVVFACSFTVGNLLLGIAATITTAIGIISGLVTLRKLRRYS